jgi:S1-C subfamily serine protease
MPSYSAKAVRTGPVAAIAAGCALLGGVLALVVGHLSGWTDSSSTTTVFRAAPVQPGPTAAPAAVGPGARPLAGNGFSPSAIYARRSPGVVTIVAIYGTDPESPRRAQGSGFVVSPQGYILTNSHVITTAGDAPVAQAADSVFIEFQDRDRAEAKIVGWDVFDDVGLVKVDPSAHALAPVPLANSAAVVVGEPVAAIGSPFGNENSLAVGVVSAVHRSVDSQTSSFNLVDAIQTDAPINHGNSGGPLFDARGRVIGINAQINSTSGEAEGVGFAVPINSAKRSMQQLIANGSVSYAFVGVETTDLTPALARRFGYPVQRGAVVTDIVAGSPAEKAGLHPGRKTSSAFGLDFPRSGDVIVAIDGRRVTGSEDIARIVTSMSPGQVARFAIERGDSHLVLPLRLGERSESS